MSVENKNNDENVLGNRPKRASWSAEENELIVGNYFEMLMEELAGRKFNKAAYARKIAPYLKARITKDAGRKGAFRRKYCNISAVLRALGQPWVEGFNPNENIQLDLADVVAAHLEKNRHAITRAIVERLKNDDASFEGIEMQQPQMPESLSAKEIAKIDRIITKFDVAAKDKYNRDLGYGGEKLVYENEIFRLRKAGLESLVEKVSWVSRDIGDGLGYDIESYDLDQRKRLIEVKTTNGDGWFPFFVTANERNVSREKADQGWCLFRVYDFNRGPKAFELNSKELETRCHWDTATYQVKLKQESIFPER